MAKGSRLFGLRKDLWFKFKGNWARNPGNVHRQTNMKCTDRLLPAKVRNSAFSRIQAWTDWMKPAHAVEESAVLKPVPLIVNFIPQHPRKPPRVSLSKCVGTGVMVYPIEYMLRKSATLGSVPRVPLNNDKNLDTVIQPNLN